MVPYVVSAVVVMTVMHVLLFVLHVCMLRECEGARLTQCWCGVRGRCGCGEYIWVVHVFCLVQMTCLR